jgi:hypothetical protein
MKLLVALTLCCNAMTLVSLLGMMLVEPREEHLWIVWLFYLLVTITPMLSIVTILARRPASRATP